MISRTRLFTLVLLAIAPVALRADAPTVIQPGEELVYKVKYGFVRLGTATVTTERDNTSTDPNQYRVVVKLDSSPGMPVSLHEYNVSIVDATKMMSKSFYGLHTKSGTKLETQFHYDEAAKRAYFFRKNPATGEKSDEHTLENVPPYLEGPSMFFFGRQNVRSGKVMDVPTLVDGAMSSTHFDFSKGRQYINIDAVDHHVRTRKYEGQIATDNASSVGVSGLFSIWVSDDEASVPMRAEFKILVGSVSLELEKWRRADWQPPS